MSRSLESLNSRVFSEQLHTQFRLLCDGLEPLPLELIEVKEADPSPKIELFSLHFLGPAEPRMPQCIHTLEHDKLGRIEIFLTAIAGDEQGITYESVFHRIRKNVP